MKLMPRIKLLNGYFELARNKLAYIAKLLKDKKKTFNFQLSTFNLRLKRSGLSLVELLVYIAVFSVVSILFVTIVLTNSRLFSNQKTNIYLASQNRLALDEMTNQIREAQEVVTDCTICGDSSSPNTILILKLWPIDVNGDAFDPATTTGPDYIVYKRDVSSRQVIKEVYVTTGNGSSRANSTDILASDVINLEFAYDIAPPETSQVTIILKNEASSIHRTHNFEQSTMATLRNKPIP